MMNPEKLFTTLFLIAALILIVFAASACTTPGAYDRLAQCLTDNGAVMYGTEWCSHCQNQKKAFGNSFEYVTFIDCDKDKPACITAGIEGYPTWVINDTKYTGEQNFYNLAKHSGCLEALQNTSK